MNIRVFFKKRDLRKIQPSLEKSKSSMIIAELKLDEAKRLFHAEFFNNVILSAYTSMFHASRVLLYKDGIQEKSHYATYFYIKEIYSKVIPKSLINSFNILREARHDVLYGFKEEMSREEAESAILDAEEFLIEVKRIYEKKT